MYIKLTNGIAELYTLRDLRNDNPDLLFRADPTNEFLSGHSMYPYTASAKPTYDAATQVVEHQGYAETDGTYGDVYAVRDKTEGELAAELDSARQRMKCSAMQGILTLGEAKWGEVITYRDHVDTTWAEKMIIDSAQDWKRLSQNIAFFGQLLNYTEVQMDNMFTAAAGVSA
jgi:hypothetical protein